MPRLVPIGLFALAVAAAFSPPAPAQSSASSVGYFLLCPERASGGRCTSTNFRLEGALGAGVVGRLAFSSNFKLLGGINAAANAPVTGTPWLSGAAPLYGPLLGGTVHTLHGHNLALGLATAATVGGQGATIASRASDRIVVKLPAQTSPGYKPVTATNSGGTAHLSPRGVGVLPLIELAWPIEIGQPWRLTYRGKQGDLIYIAVAAAKLPGGLVVPVSPYHHGLELNLGTFIGLIGPLPVASPTGTFTLDFPGSPISRPIHVQMLALPSTPAGYNPGSFTNTIAL